jgi:hypothetical protein
MADLDFITRTNAALLSAPPPPLNAPDADEPRAPIAGAAPGGGDAYWNGSQYVDKGGSPVASLNPPPAPANGGASDLNSIGSKLAIAQLAKQGKFDYTPPAPTNAPLSLSGLLANLGARGNEANATWLGAPVDLATGIINNFATPERARNFLEGRGNTPLIDKPFAGYESMSANSHEVQPQNEIERLAGGAGSAIGQALGAVLGARALAPVIPSSAPVTAGVVRSLGEAPLPSTVAAAGVGGATGQGAEDLIPDQYAQFKPLAGLGGNLVGGIGTAGGITAGKYAGQQGFDLSKRLLAPLTQGGRQRLAGQTLLDAATNPTAVRSALEDGLENAELVPGSRPTTAQLTQDTGVEQLRRGLATRNPVPFKELDAQNAAARVEAMQNLAPEGSASGSVGDYLTQRMADTDAQTQGLYDAAVDRAAQKVQALGGNMDATQRGMMLRDELSSAKTQAKDAESALWQQINPDGKLALDVTPAKQAALAIKQGMPADARPMTGEEQRLFGIVQMWPDVRDFNNVTALRSDLLAAIRQEQLPTGSPTVLRRMQMLRQAIDNNIAGGAQDAVASGAPGSEALASTPQPQAGAPSIGTGVFTPSGRRVGVRYEVVEGNSLVPSNNQDLTPNPAYPPELQPRQRYRAASNAQIQYMAGGLEPERLGAAASPVEGAPIVGPDGVVESGNARTLAIMRAYQQGAPKAQAYRDFLERQGFNVEGMQNPVLIRRRVTDLAPDERIRFTQEANASPGLALSATERATIDAERLSPNVLDLYSGGDVSSAENRDFARAFIRSVPEKGEEGAMVTPQGQLSVEGVQRVRNALLAKAYGDANLVGGLAETGEPNIKAFGAALQSVAGDVAKLNGEIAAGRVPKDMDLSVPLAQAADLVQRAKASGRSFSSGALADLVAQSDAFSSLNPETIGLLKAAYGSDMRGRLNAARYGDALRFIASEATKQSTAAQLLGNNLTLADVLSAGVRRYGTAFESASPTNVTAYGGGYGPGPREGGAQAPGYGPGAPGPGVAGAGTPGTPTSPLGLLAPQTPVANFNEAAAQRYRAAANATRERVQTFGRGPVGQTLREQPGGGGFTLSDAQVAGKFFNSGPKAFDDVNRLLAAVGDRPRAVELLQDYAAESLRDYAERADGSLDPAKYAKWMDNHAAALRVFPELAEKFQTAADATRAIDLNAIARKEALEVYQKGVASKFIGSEPAQAVATALRSKDPAGAFRKLSDLIGSDADAQAGLQRATVELLEKRFLGGEAGVRPAMFQRFVSENRAALSEVFSPEQMDAIDNLGADLKRWQWSVNSKLPGTPGTAADLHAAGEGKTSLLQLLLVEHAGHVGGHVLGGGVLGWAGGLVGVVGLAMRKAGLGKIDDLLTEAMLDPALAKTLIEKATPKTAPELGKTLAAQIRALSASAGGQALLRQPPPEPAPSQPSQPVSLLGFPSPGMAPQPPSSPLLRGTGPIRPNLLLTPPTQR